MGGNGGKGRGEICREEESLIWIAKCEGRDLEGLIPFILLTSKSLQKRKDLEGK